MPSLKEKLTENLHKALELGSKEEKIDAYLRLALFDYNTKHYENSKRNLEQIIKLDKNAKFVNYYLALIELNLGNNETAKKHLQDEIEINPENFNAKSLLERIRIHSNFPIITITIALISIIVFMMTFASPTYVDLLRYGLSTSNFSFFSSITSIFLHANIIHLLLNIVILLIFGLYLEKYIGSSKFLSIFLLSAIIGNVAETYFSISHSSFIIGMSAGLFGILGTIVLREPLLDVRLFGFVKIPIIIFFGIIFILNWLSGYFITNTQILFGEMAHIFGFLTGVFITGITQRETISTFYNWLVMAFGFTAITYGLSRTINLFSVFNANEMMTATTMYLLGIFLIFFSYIKLKLSLRLRGEAK